MGNKKKDKSKSLKLIAPNTLIKQGSMLSASGKNLQCTFDFECYRNYLLMMFVDWDNKKAIPITMYNDKIYIANKKVKLIDSKLILNGIIHNYNMISFNGLGYDQLIMEGFMKGFNNATLKRMTNDIITNHMLPWDVRKKYKTKQLYDIDHVDIMNVCKGTASLKVYAARLGCKDLRELPIRPEQLIMPSNLQEMNSYCFNDNLITKLVYDDVVGDVKLRANISKQYNDVRDFRSFAPQAIAEFLFNHAYKKKTGTSLEKPKNIKNKMEYKAPKYMEFKTKQFTKLFKKIKKETFKLSEAGKLVIPKSISETFIAYGKEYNVGVGGLHSANDRGSHYSDDKYAVKLIDVSSYYPATILNIEAFPKHIGKVFIKIYRDFLNNRLSAKSAVDKLNSNKKLSKKQKAKMADLFSIITGVKIILNGAYGKLNERHSKLRSPDMMLRVTLTGQLSLFMLIETLGMANIQVISVNTDGIAVRVKRTKIKKMEKLVKKWEKKTNYSMDYDDFESIHYRDVNNYFHCDPDNTSSGIGYFAKHSLGKNLDNFIVSKACMDFVKDGVSVEKTIYENTDINNFLSLQQVSGGAVFDGEEAGKVVRFYHSSKSTNCIYRKKSGNKVPLSANTQLLNVLPAHISEIDDIDYGWYINESKKMLTTIGVDQNV